MRTISPTFAGLTLVAATFAATLANAQSAFTGSDVAEERNKDLLEAIEDDAERDLDAFGNEGRAQGFNGSIAMRASAKSGGDTDTTDVGVAANFLWVDGPNGYDVQLNYTYGETDGTVTKREMYYGLEYTRDFSDKMFGFGKVQGSVDSFSDIETDNFVSAGLGYRVVNTATTQWSVQAGPGYRVSTYNIVSPDVTEVAFGASSDYSTRLSDAVTLTNDTDVISSETDTVIFNDLAVSVAMSDALALRASVLTEDHSSPASTENTFGVSLVYKLK